MATIIIIMNLQTILQEGFIFLLTIEMRMMMINAGLIMYMERMIHIEMYGFGTQRRENGIIFPKGLIGGTLHQVVVSAEPVFILVGIKNVFLCLYSKEYMNGVGISGN